MGLASYRRSVIKSKRAAILKAARENFLESGFSRVAMAMIARDADVSTATLYKHFASKDALFAAVVREAHSETEANMHIDIGTTPAHTILKNITDAYVKQQLEGQMNNLLRVVIAEVPSAPHLATEVYEKGMLVRYGQFRAVIDSLVARGDLKPHDTEISSHCFGGMVKEFSVWPALFSQDFSRPHDLDDKIAICIDSYLKIYQAEKN